MAGRELEVFLLLHPPSASLRITPVKPSAPYACLILGLRAVIWALLVQGILGAVNIQLPHVDPLRLQLPAGAGPSALHPAVCRICHQLLFPWMHSHIRHMQTLAVMLSPVCKQCWRTASLYQLRSLGGLLIPSLEYHCAVSQAVGPSLVSHPDSPVSHSPVGTQMCV